MSEVAHTSAPFDAISGLWPWPSSSAPPFEPGGRTDNGAVTPHKPLADLRSYRAVTLSNGLRALLVHDAAADKAAAALSVNVGHLSDPPSLPGLSHAVEHMLFLGTASFPDEAEYKRFLKDHGGASNASTSAESTTYHFMVHYAHLQGALARFCAFFVSPLFTESATERELKAVDAENARNLSLDGRRDLQVSKHLARPESVWRKFGTGNLDTLSRRPAALGIDVRAAMLQHYATFYSANLMQLAVLGRESLDELEALVTGGGGGGGSEVADFRHVPNKAIAVPLHDGSDDHRHPYQRAQLARSVFLTPVKDVRTLSLFFPIPSPALPHYGRAATRCVSHLVGHEGKGSLLSLLKARGLAIGLSAGASWYRHYSAFSIEVALTPLGLERSDDIVRLVLQYALLLSRMHDPALAAVFNEISQVASNSVRFRATSEPSSAVQTAVASLQVLPAVDALVGGELMTRLDADAVRAVVACLVAPHNLLVTLTSKSFGDAACQAGLAAALPGLEVREEPFYKFGYMTAPFSPEQLCLWGAGEPSSRQHAGDDWDLTPAALPLCSEFQLPLPNAFIPSDFTLVPPPIAEAAAGAAATPVADRLVLGQHELDLSPSIIASAGRRLEVARKFPVPTLLAASARPGGESSDKALTLLRSLPACPDGVDGADLRTEGGLPVRIFFRTDSRFMRPKTFLRAKISLPRWKALCTQGGPDASGTQRRNKAVAPLFIDVLQDLLVEETYEASIAGLQADVDVDVEDNSLGLVVTGYSHKHAVLLERVLAGLAGFSTRSDAELEPIFVRRLEARRRALSSWSRAQPRDRAVAHLRELLQHPAQSYESWLADLDGVGLSDLRAFAAGLFDSMALEHGDVDGEELGASVELLLYGNVRAEDARDAARLISLTLGRAGARRSRAELAGLAAEALGGEGEGAAQLRFPEPRGLLLPPGSDVVLTRAHPSAEERNAAVHAVFQLGAATPRTRALARLLAMLVAQPAFAQLRTVEQLGYVVGADATTTGGGAIAALYLSVQSSAASVEHVEARMEAFLVAFRDQLAKESGASVAAKARVLADRMLEADKTQGAECARLWDAIADGTYDFASSECVATAVLALTAEDLLAAWDACISAGGALRRRALSRVYAQRPLQEPATHAAVAGDGDSLEARGAAALAGCGGGPAAAPALRGACEVGASDAEALAFKRRAPASAWVGRREAAVG